MLPPLFYASWDNSDNEVVILTPDEAKHATKVLRLKIGAPVILIDGLGRACKGGIKIISPRRVTVLIHSEIRDFGEPLVRLTLAAGISVGSKFDTVVQQGTELGVKRFVPIISDKGKVDLSDPKRARARVKRLEKVALASAKQSRRSFRPEISLPVKLSEYLSQRDNETHGLIFHPAGRLNKIEDLNIDKSIKRIDLLIGSESGFTDIEYESALAAGFLPVSLGSRILRAETAAPIAAALVMSYLGELS